MSINIKLVELKNQITKSNQSTKTNQSNQSTKTNNTNKSNQSTKLNHSNINFDKVKIIKILGSGFLGTTYLINF